MKITPTSSIVPVLVRFVSSRVEDASRVHLILTLESVMTSKQNEQETAQHLLFDFVCSR
jgi:hypothetical protein